MHVPPLPTLKPLKRGRLFVAVQRCAVVVHRCAVVVQRCAVGLFCRLWPFCFSAVPPRARQAGPCAAHASGPVASTKTRPRTHMSRSQQSQTQVERAKNKLRDLSSNRAASSRHRGVTLPLRAPCYRARPGHKCVQRQRLNMGRQRLNMGRPHRRRKRRTSFGQASLG